MKSLALPSFWTAYSDLGDEVKASARSVHQIWSRNPFHPSLHLKCINPTDSVRSVRGSRGHRAVGILDGNTLTWIWIGNHDEYKRFFS